MPIVPQDSPDQGRIFEAMRADLETWGAALRPAADVVWAHDAERALELILGSQSEGARIVLTLASDRNVDREVNPLMLENTFDVLVQAGKGMTRDEGRLAIKGETGRPSLESTVAAVRMRVLAWRFDVTVMHRGFVLYDGRSALIAPDGIPLAGFRLSFHFRAAAPSGGTTVTITIPG